jgi:hypothetical protein
MASSAISGGSNRAQCHLGANRLEKKIGDPIRLVLTP